MKRKKNTPHGRAKISIINQLTPPVFGVCACDAHQLDSAVARQLISQLAKSFEAQKKRPPIHSIAQYTTELQYTTTVMQMTPRLLSVMQT